MENVLKKLIAEYPERHIKVLGGRQLIAEKKPDEDFIRGKRSTNDYGRVFAEKKPHEPFIRVKTAHCNYCGECCLGSPGTKWGEDEEGRCNALVKFGDIWECSAGADVPYRCLDDPADIPECCIRYRKVKVT